MHLQSTTARKVSFDDITGASLKEESSFGHSTAGASLKVESSYGFGSYATAGASLKEESSFGYATSGASTKEKSSSFSKCNSDRSRLDSVPQKQLDPVAIWISVIFLLTFPPRVLAAYVAQLLLLLKTLPIESHVKGLDNVTHISTLLALDPNLQEKLLSGFLPSWLNLIFLQDFGWHSFTTELLDSLQLESRSTFAGADLGAYLKATHQKKEIAHVHRRM